jgi:Domain of unknown function (DUF4394)
MPQRPHPTGPALALGALALVLAFVLAGCASPGADEPAGSPRPQTVFAVTESHMLIRFNAGTPRQVEAGKPITGLAAGETLLGIDFRVARGVLYGLTSAGRLVTIDTASAAVRPVGSAPPVALQGTRFGVDFNPVADRVRVVSDSGQNLRFHPDTGALAATDPPLAAATEGGPAPRIAGAGYTYNKANDKLTTNYAIDIARGWLVTQGSVEGREPVVSPNTGRIADVGPLGTGPLDDAAFDIADIGNVALAALRQGGRTRLVVLDLTSGRATLLGTVANGEALRGMAIEP